MCLLEIITNEIPYKECDNVAQIWRCVSEKINPESLTSVKEPIIYNLIMKCIDPDPDKRPTVDQLMKENFFTNTDIDDTVIDFNLTVNDKSVEEEIQETLELESH